MPKELKMSLSGEKRLHTQCCGINRELIPDSGLQPQWEEGEGLCLRACVCTCLPVYTQAHRHAHIWVCTYVYISPFQGPKPECQNLQAIPSRRHSSHHCIKNSKRRTWSFPRESAWVLHLWEGKGYWMIRNRASICNGRRTIAKVKAVL